MSGAWKSLFVSTFCAPAGGGWVDVASLVRSLVPGKRFLTGRERFSSLLPHREVMAHDDPEQKVRLAREDLLERADLIDGGVRALLGQLDLTRTDTEFERMLDALMGVSRAADALRALARNDLESADEATASMSHYAKKALGSETP